MVTVHLHTVLQLETPQGRVGRLEVAWVPGLTVAKLIDQIAIHLNEEHTLLVVNGMICESHRLLQDGDEVHLIPAISGGRL